MKKIFKAFLYVVVFFIAVIVFLPKESFYNLLEKELEKKQIIISNEIRNEKFFDFEVLDGEIFYEGINVAKLDKLTFSSYFVYTKIEASNLHFLESFKAFMPTPTKNIFIEYSVLNPNKIKIKADGIFGELSGEVDIFTRNARIELIASKEMKNAYFNLLRNMKYENERYIYEYKF